MTFVELVAGFIDTVVAKLAAVGAALGVAVGVLRGLIEQKYGSVRAWVAGLAAALLVGVLVHLALHDAGLAPTLHVAITCAAAFVADDALRGLRALAALVGSDPLGAAKRIMAALRGGSAKE